MVHQTDFYTYRVQWSEQDKEHVGLCAEFPSLSWLDADPDEAFKGIRRLVKEVLSDMQENREPIPEPLSTRQYSGEFKVRIPPYVHRRLVLEAAENHVSLNSLIKTLLAQVAFTAGESIGKVARDANERGTSLSEMGADVLRNSRR